MASVMLTSVGGFWGLGGGAGLDNWGQVEVRALLRRKTPKTMVTVTFCDTGNRLRLFLLDFPFSLVVDRERERTVIFSSIFWIRYKSYNFSKKVELYHRRSYICKHGWVHDLIDRKVKYEKVILIDESFHDLSGKKGFLNDEKQEI